MAAKNNNNQLALRCNHHQISSFDLSSVGCSPFFCYFTARNVAIASNNRQELHKPSLTSSSSSTTKFLKTTRHHKDQAIAEEGAVSPKVGCMGQIKKTGKGSNRKVRQFRSMLSFSVKGARVDDDYSRQAIGVADTMDLPLPVKRNVADRDSKVDSLWKRRHGRDRNDLYSLDVVQLKLQAQVHLQQGFGCTRESISNKCR